MTIEERVDMEAEKLSGPEIGKKIRTKKVLTYVMTTLGGTFIPVEEAELAEEGEVNG